MERLFYNRVVKGSWVRFYLAFVALRLILVVSYFAVCISLINIDVHLNARHGDVSITSQLIENLTPYTTIHTYNGAI